jgi:hypothetical protein
MCVSRPRPSGLDRLPVVAAAALLAALSAVSPGAQAPGWTTYRDAQGRFSFDYPQQFGTPDRGTNDGFADRVAAVRFSGLAGLGGEAVLTRGRVVMDVQALGGLYDPIALEIFPDAMRRQVVAVLPPVTPQSACQLLAAADHVPADRGLAANVLEAARRVDRMRNVAPRVVRCDVKDGVLAFHKETTFESGFPAVRQHIFGALRFLTAQGDAFQIIRVLATPPAAADLETLERLVRSYSTGVKGPAGAGSR